MAKIPKTPAKTPRNCPVAAEAVSLLDSHRAPAILVSRDYRILAANAAYRREYGEGDILERRCCFEVSHHYAVPCDQAGESCPLKVSLETGQPQRVLHLHQTPRGEEHVEVETYPVRDDQGNICYFLEIMRYSRVASPNPRAGGLVGRAPAFNRALELVQRVAPSEATVLLLGESGTGKELVAAAVHEASPRAKGPFVAVDCSGLTETLFESELFGHEKGAFTGAQAQKIGLVEAAGGGTLFLDEIGDVPLSLQVKLLRLLETGTYRRVGGIEPRKADFRLVCATHQKLRDMVDEGSFRRDLYYRINAFPITLPPLRQRMEDLPVLAEGLLHRVAPNRQLRLSQGALACLMSYGFPGNIRELRNMLERASLMADGEVILPVHLPEDCTCANPPPPLTGAMPDEIVPLEEAEERYLRWARARFQGERRELARALGLSERTLYRKLQSLDKGVG